MRNTDEKTIVTQQVTTKSTRTVDCFRKITDAETGVTEVKRWQDERQVTANLQAVDKGRGGVFHNGARIA
jgi:hypothetical protein